MYFDINCDLFFVFVKENHLIMVIVSQISAVLQKILTKLFTMSRSPYLSVNVTVQVLSYQAINISFI